MAKFKVRAMISNVVEIDVEAESRDAADDLARNGYDEAWLEAVDREMDFDIKIRPITPVADPPGPEERTTMMTDEETDVIMAALDWARCDNLDRANTRSDKNRELCNAVMKLLEKQPELRSARQTFARI